MSQVAYPYCFWVTAEIWETISKYPKICANHSWKTIAGRRFEFVDLDVTNKIIIIFFMFLINFAKIINIVNILIFLIYKKIYKKVYAIF